MGKRGTDALKPIDITIAECKAQVILKDSAPSFHYHENGAKNASRGEVGPVARCYISRRARFWIGRSPLLVWF